MELDTAKRIIFVIMVTIALVEIARRRFFHRDRTTSKDLLLDVVCPLAVPLGGRRVRRIEQGQVVVRCGGHGPIPLRCFRHRIH